MLTHTLLLICVLNSLYIMNNCIYLICVAIYKYLFRRKCLLFIALVLVCLALHQQMLLNLLQDL